MVAVCPPQHSEERSLATADELVELAPALADQVRSHVDPPPVPGRFASRTRGQLDGRLGDFLLGLTRAAGNLLDGAAIAIACCEIHCGKNAGWIMAQRLFHTTRPLDDLLPVHQGELPEAREGVADRDLVLCLAVLLARAQLAERRVKDPFQPALNRRTGSLFIVEVVDQLKGKIRARPGLVFRQLRHDREQGGGVPPVGGDKPVRPEIGDLAVSQLREAPGGEILDALEQRDAQHLGDRPQLADPQGAHGLVGLDKGDDGLTVDPQTRVSHKLPGQRVDARQIPVGPALEGGQ